jgi:hypothetical protein
MSERQAGPKVRTAFENEYQPPAPGFDSRMRAALERAPEKARRARWPFELAAATFAMLVVLVIVLARVLPMVSNGITSDSITSDSHADSYWIPGGPRDV